MASNFPVGPAEIVETLAALVDAQGDHPLAEILRTSIPRIEDNGYDNWNGGTTYYALHLELPVNTYARIEPGIQETEAKLIAKLVTALRGTGNQVLNAVLITPAFGESAPPVVVGDDEVARIWGSGRFRLFLSHVSEHKIAVSALKQSLSLLGVAGFVAHEDIEPTLEWQREIERALESMHAMAAVLTEDFHGSNWTDQEVGIAVGKGILVLPIRAPVSPYGFIAKSHGLRGDLTDPVMLASKVVNTLTSRPRTADGMREALVATLEVSRSFAQSKAITEHLERARTFTPDEVARVHRAIGDNSQVRDSFGVADRLRRLVGPLPPEPVVPELDDLPF